MLLAPVSAISRANGFPNSCWGWGGEDDILRSRLVKVGVPPTGPLPTAGNYTELPHEHQGSSPATKNMRRWEDIQLHSTDLGDGLGNAKEVAAWALHDYGDGGKTATAVVTWTQRRGG